jgi:RNA polymerase sigma-70 factor (ECF subfamily)
VVTDWNLIVREHGPRVFAAAWRILGHAADAEDVVQEVFLEAHRVALRAPVRCWPALLRRLAVCRGLDRLRQRKVHASPGLNGANLISPDPGPEEALLEKELAGRLRVALGQLTPRESSVFCLRYFEDLSYQQIAETLDLRPGAVGVALHKARSRLEELLRITVPGE